ncbi:MAG: flavodoxin-dependent (E)-4-hydroxy-3-methylbut-2-enyl-diphosphate synthase [Candidatus Omnitrophica bacterium]|nr:flavodoxin-dependent (E)-4-hydroxy-3-methylbut-2-enyl-diphosphate synthase [Candidatus Omnitrophota bacterium]
MRIKRRRSKKIKVGNIFIGGNAPISIQSMTTTDTKDVKATVAQIKKLERLGCRIIRVAVPDCEAAKAIRDIKKKVKIPLVADIHFDYRLALLSIENGADKIRLNPGNIQKKSHIEAVLKHAEEKRVPIRIGLNSGSVKRSKSGGVVSDMLKAAFFYERLFKQFKFQDMIFSFKTHDVLTTVKAYREFARLSDAPLHLGLTAAGPEHEGIVKSNIALGCLLLEGIGDTLRVSLTADPVKEIEAGKRILSAIGLLNEGIEIISCPTCGRCTIDLMEIVSKAEKILKPFNKKLHNRKLKVAIMGCVVNGPGEAKDADIGVAWGGKSGLLFKKGKKIKLIKKKELLSALVAEVKNEVV